ncbi:MAG: hypothetical protein HRT57_03095 [Crocinitomicaceae bacterium]|nr:hypothetical protein [Crocinitomicaceae bacterium]
MKLLFSILLILTVSTVNSQITFQKELIADSTFYISRTIKTSDQGYICVGRLKSGQMSWDGALVKMDSSWGNAKSCG